MNQKFENIRYDRTDNVAGIVLNNPPLNIMTQAMICEINSVLCELIEDESLHLLIFKADGKHFSAGADVGEHTKEKCSEMIPEFMKLFYNLSRISCPIIAAVQGSALGGGCELALYCDMVLAADNAKIGQPEISLGVFPPVGVVIFPLLVGRNKAMELLLTGDVIPAVEAERIGLINRVYPQEQFQEKVQEFIAKLKSKSPVILKLSKKIIDQGLSKPFYKALETAEETYLHELMETGDANEGLLAFLEKRAPLWKGK